MRARRECRSGHEVTCDNAPLARSKEKAEAALDAFEHVAPPSRALAAPDTLTHLGNAGPRR